MRAGCYAALFTAPGKYLHDFIVIAKGQSIWLDAQAARFGDVKSGFRSTRLRARASADERPDLAAAAVFGEVTLTALNLSSEPGIAGPFGSLVDLVDPRLTALGARCVLPLATAREALAKAGLADAGIEGCDHLRVSLGIPDGSRDLMQHSARRHSRLP